MALEASKYVICSKQRIFSENQDYKYFLSVVITSFVPILKGSRCTWWHKTSNIHTHTNTWDTTVTLAAHAHGGLINYYFHFVISIVVDTECY